MLFASEACNPENNDVVAIKFLCREKIREWDVAEKIIQEILNHNDLHHPHITKLHMTLSCPTHIIMVMEYVSGGELFEYIVAEGRVK